MNEFYLFNGPGVAGNFDREPSSFLISFKCELLLLPGNETWFTDFEIAQTKVDRVVLPKPGNTRLCLDVKVKLALIDVRHQVPDRGLF